MKQTYKKMVLRALVTIMSLNFAFGQSFDTGDLNQLLTFQAQNFNDPSQFNWSTQSNPLNWNGVTWDASNPRRITTIDFSSSDLKGSMDFTTFDSIRDILVQNNQNLKGVNILGLPLLNYFNGSNTGISGTIDVSGSLKLTSFYIDNSNVTSLNFAGDTNLTNGNFRNCAKLAYLNLTDCKNYSSSLDLENCNFTSGANLILTGTRDITWINLKYNSLKGALDLSNMRKLNYLRIGRENSLSSLNLTGDTLLTDLHLGNGASGTPWNAIIGKEDLKKRLYNLQGLKAQKDVDISGFSTLQHVRAKDDYRGNLLESINVTGDSLIRTCRLSRVGNLKTYIGYEDFIQLESSSINYNSLDLTTTMKLAFEYSLRYRGNNRSIEQTNAYDFREIQLGDFMDYSAEDSVEINGIKYATTFNFYDANNNLLATNNTGIYAPTSAGTYYCILVNNNLSLNVSVRAKINIVLDGTISPDFDMYSKNDYNVLMNIYKTNITPGGVNWAFTEDLSQLDGVRWDNSTPKRVRALFLGNTNNGSGNIRWEKRWNGENRGSSGEYGTQMTSTYNFTEHGSGYGMDSTDSRTQLFGKLDVSNLEKLEKLYLARQSGITSLNVSGLEDVLTYLHVSQTSITNLNLAGFKALTFFRGKYLDQLVSADLSDCIGLRIIKMGYAEKMKNFSAEGCTSLEVLHLGNAYELKSLDISDLAMLRDLKLKDDDNQDDDPLAFSFGNNPELVSFRAPYTTFTSLDFQKLNTESPKIEHLAFCYGYLPKSVIIEDWKELTHFHNQWENNDERKGSVKFANNPKLEMIAIGDHSFSSIIVENNPELMALGAYSAGNGVVTKYKLNNNPKLVRMRGYDSQADYADVFKTDDFLTNTNLDQVDALDSWGYTWPNNLELQDNRISLTNAVHVDEMLNNTDVSNQTVDMYFEITVPDSVEYDEDSVDIDMAGTFMTTTYTISPTIPSTGESSNNDGVFNFTTNADAGYYTVTKSCNGVSVTTEQFLVRDSLASNLVVNDVNFGKVHPGLTSTLPVVLTNTGLDTIKVTDITVPAGFKFADTTATILGGKSVSINITFSPTAHMSYTTSSFIFSDAASGDFIFNLYASGYDSTTGIIENEIVSKVYPNPTSDYLFIEGYNGTHGQLNIYSVMGVLVSTTNIINNNTVIDVRKLESGVYIISSPDKTFNKRFIKL